MTITFDLFISKSSQFTFHENDSYQACGVGRGWEISCEGCWSTST